jgi:TRAP-type C4-dicarboxylate transport system permease small subunit
MLAFTRFYSRIAAHLSFYSLVLAGLGLIAMTLIVGWTVFGRYILNETPTWGETVSLLLMLWFILLGGAVGVREMDHMGFDIGLHYAKGRTKKILVFVNEALVTLFGFAMVYYGFLLTSKVWSDRLPMIGISKGWDYIPMIAGGVLIAFFSFEKLLLTFVGQERVPMPYLLDVHGLGGEA